MLMMKIMVGSRLGRREKKWSAREGEGENQMEFISPMLSLLCQQLPHRSDWFCPGHNNALAAKVPRGQIIMSREHSISDDYFRIH